MSSCVCKVRIIQDTNIVFDCDSMSDGNVRNKEEDHDVRNESTEEQRGLMDENEVSPELNEVEQSSSCPQTENTAQKRAKNNKGKKISTVTCLECGKSFTCKGSLRDHTRIHTGEKPFTCHHCGKSFTQNSSLKIHINMHAKEKPFTCDHCGKGFTYKRSLADHMTIHTGEKPFTCSQCGKTFSRRISLTSHMSSHSSERPFICSQCGKSFTKAVNLKAHETVHADVKPFHCALCEKSFGHSGGLRRHLKSFIHNKFKPLERLMFQSFPPKNNAFK